MKVRSVNVSEGVQVPYRGEFVHTGIFKTPILGPVDVGATQIAGDRQSDMKNHGGPDKAVYGYPWEHYAHWASVLHRDDFTPGQFGENLTTEGLLESSLCIGDRLHIGSVLLEVSQPRIPCYKLGIRMGLPDFPNTFLKSGLVGFYFRVLQAGTLQPGDTIAITPSIHERVAVQEVSHVRFFDHDDKDAMERIVSNPALAANWRRFFEDRLTNPPQ